MPFANEHAARQVEPEGFARFRRNHPEGWPAGIDAVFGVRSDGTTEIQSVRFDSSKFTTAQAKAWLKEQGFKSGSLEEASKAGKSFESRVPITKVIEEQRVVIGWGYVTRDPSNKIVPPERTLEDGTVVDWSGEVIDIDDLEKASYGFAEHSREGDVMHEGPVAASMVASFPFTPDTKKALGLPDDFPEGLVLGFRVHDDTAWGDVRSGKLKMLSLAGACKREEF